MLGYKLYWGRLAEMKQGVSKKGTPYCACLLEAQGRWNGQQREINLIKVYYYDTGERQDATKCLARSFLVNRIIALVARNTANDSEKMGVELPTSHGYLKIPAECKENVQPEEIKSFLEKFEIAKKYQKLPSDFSVNVGKVYDLVNLYNVIATSSDFYLKELRLAVLKLFWGERWAFIGPIGNTFKIRTGEIRISVCPYHDSSTPATWGDITFWDKSAIDRITRCGLASGDICCFDGLFRRPDYNGKLQFAGDSFHLISRKSDRNA